MAEPRWASWAAPGPLVYVGRLDDIVLADDDRHHLGRVRRLRDGEPLIVADGTGGWRSAAWRSVGEPEPTGPIEAEPLGPSVGIAFAPVKAEKPEWVVGKLTELGVNLIVPIQTTRSVVPVQRASIDRLRRAAREAGMQSKRARLPAILEPATLAALVAAQPVVLAAAGGEPASSVDTPVLAAIGPEGGWAPEELALVPRHLALGHTVLRAETAALVAAALLMSSAGIGSPR
jgi:16S rRNA (uracil1498-N3)-methyltransferase